MEKRELKIGDVVQINETIPDHKFIGAFLIVTEPKSFGAMGYLALPQPFDIVRYQGFAYLRVKFEEIDYIGYTTLMPVKNENEDDKNDKN